MFLLPEICETFPTSRPNTIKDFIVVMQSIRQIPPPTTELRSVPHTRGTVVNLPLTVDAL